MSWSCSPTVSPRLACQAAMFVLGRSQSRNFGDILTLTMLFIIQCTDQAIVQMVSRVFRDSTDTLITTSSVLKWPFLLTYVNGMYIK